MLEAFIGGERDPAVLADLAQKSIRSKIPALTEALRGRFNDHHAFMTRFYLDRIDAHDADIARLEERIQEDPPPLGTYASARRQWVTTRSALCRARSIR
jgi:transposase